jgi:sugar/nucleoside kinase (ribokinase family)
MPKAIIVGNLCVDDLIHPDGRVVRRQPGGNALFGALGLRLWCDDIGIAAIVGDGYPRDVIEALSGVGVDTSGAIERPQPAVHNRIDYSTGRGRVLTRLAGRPERNTPLPCDLPQGWESVSAAHLGSCPAPLQCEWAIHLERVGATVSLDPHVERDEEYQATLREALGLVDFFIPSEHELTGLLPGFPFDEAAAIVDGWSREGAVITCAERGVFLTRPQRWMPPCPVGQVVDQTGAGDAYGAAFLWGWMQTGDSDQAHRWGAVAASFMIEGEGGLHTLAITPDQAQARLQQWMESTAD